MTRIGSLCTGYGGLDMAAEAVTGGAVAWVAEIAKDPSLVLAHRYPHVPNVGDFTVTDWGVMPNGYPAIDVLTAGYP